MVIVWSILRSYSVFLGATCVHRRYICYTFNFSFVNLYSYVWGMGSGGFSQEPRKTEVKIFLLPYSIYCNISFIKMLKSYQTI